MFEYLEKLRQKPVHERKRVALLSSGAITTGVALVWATVALTSPSLSNGVKISDQEAAAAGLLFKSDGNTSLVEVLDKATESVKAAAQNNAVTTEEPVRPNDTEITSSDIVGENNYYNASNSRTRSYVDDGNEVSTSTLQY